MHAGDAEPGWIYYSYIRSIVSQRLSKRVVQTLDILYLVLTELKRIERRPIPWPHIDVEREQDEKLGHFLEHDCEGWLMHTNAIHDVIADYFLIIRGLLIELCVDQHDQDSKSVAQSDQKIGAENFSLEADGGRELFE